MLYKLTQNQSALSVIMSELRDAAVQQDRAKFRSNLERAGMIMAYEISKELGYQKREIKTPLGISNCDVLASQPVLVTVLRAGLPFHQGFLKIFDQADNGFISAYRKHKPDGNFDIVEGYITCPDLTGRDLIVIDPMLASAASAISALNQLAAYGKPANIFFASVIASQEGVTRLQETRPEVDIWVAAIDPELDHDFYIVPGLGDAGDLAFGEKLQR